MTISGSPAQGTPEDAALNTKGRDPRVQDALQWLTYAHLPKSLRRYSAPFYSTASYLITTIKIDSDELVTMLHKLIEAKDSAVRAGIRNDTGRAGSIPRPQEVVAAPYHPSDED